VVLAASIPALLLLGTTAFSQRRSSIEAAHARALEWAALLAASHARTLASARVTLGALAALPAGAFADPAECASRLGSLLSRDAQLVNLGVASPDGRVLCSAVPVPDSVSMADRRWLRQAVATRAFVQGEHRIGGIVGRPIAVAAHPLVAGDSVAAVLFASIDLAGVAELADAVPLPASTTLMVIGPEGTILLRHPDPDGWSGRRVDEAPLARAVASGASSAAVRGVDGVARFYAFLPLTGSAEGRAVLAVGIARSATLAEANRAARRIVVALLLATLLALVASRITAERLILDRTEPLVGAADRMRSGDLGARSGLAPREDELGRLAGAFDSMAETVQRQTGELEQSQRELRLLTRRTEDQVERERRRIAHAVHDELGQALTALKLDTTWLRDRIDGDDAAIARHLASMQELLDNTSRTVRRIATELRPAVLDDLGLDAAVEWQVQEFARRTGIAGDVRLHLDGVEPPTEVGTALFRILQEALTNVARHAQARRVEVTLAESAHGALLEVRDDGVGLPKTPPPNRPSLGLLSMRERAQVLGGTVSISAASPRGTLVRAEIPLPVRTSPGDASP
jgi:signal transduction histidine kinase